MGTTEGNPVDAEEVDATNPGDRATGAAEGSPARGATSVRVRWAIGLVIAGVAAMVLPGLLRDGLCGLIACADVTPEVAVGRPGGPELEVVVPEGAADQLQSLRLFRIDDEAAGSTSGSWIVYRTDDSVAPQRIPLGEEPDGFDTRTELDEVPSDGLWVLDASFGCESTLVRFAPEELDPGFVSTGDPPVQIGEFEEDARTSLRCATEAPGWQRLLFLLGALSASAGAVIGIWVLLRGPVNDEPEWYAPDEDEVG